MTCTQSIHPGLLTESDRSAVLAHLLGLSDDDLRRRFRRCMTPASIRTHVAALDFNAAIRLGIHRQGRLIALVEGFAFEANGEKTLEVAFSTDPAWRRRGLARALGTAIAALAGRQGVKRIVACCEATNGPMRAVMRAFNAEIEQEAGECHGEWASARRAQPARVVLEHVVHTTEEQTARRLFATLPLGAAYAPRLVPAMATGLLVSTIESACIAQMQEHLGKGQTVVGTEVDIRHLGPALPGHELRIRGQGRWFDGRRRIAFDVRVDDGQGPVATARVVLAVVDAARFDAGLAQRREALELVAA